MKTPTENRLASRDNRARRLARYRDSPTTGNAPPELCYAPLKSRKSADSTERERSLYASNYSTGFQPPCMCRAPARDTMVAPVARACRRLDFDAVAAQVEDEPVRDDFEVLFGDLFKDVDLDAVCESGAERVLYVSAGTDSDDEE
jgi:hypothetical protein